MSTLFDGAAEGDAADLWCAGGGFAVDTARKTLLAEGAAETDAAAVAVGASISVAGVGAGGLTALGVEVACGAGVADEDDRTDAKK